MKNTKICALEAIEAPKALGTARCIFKNATSNRFTEFNINSMHIKTIMELRLVNAPIMPMQKRMADKNIYHLISIIIVLRTSQHPPYCLPVRLKKYLLFFLRQYR